MSNIEAAITEENRELKKTIEKLRNEINGYKDNLQTLSEGVGMKLENGDLFVVRNSFDTYPEHDTAMRFASNLQKIVKDKWNKEIGVVVLSERTSLTQLKDEDLKRHGLKKI